MTVVNETDVVPSGRTVVVPPGRLEGTATAATDAEGGSCEL
jgi:hypothetical protein